MNGNLSLAFESYEKTLKVDDMHYGALLHLAILQASKAEFLIAEKNLQKALQINPNDPEAWYSSFSFRFNSCFRAHLGRIYQKQTEQSKVNYYAEQASECFLTSLRLKSAPLLPFSKISIQF